MSALLALGSDPLTRSWHVRVWDCPRNRAPQRFPVRFYLVAMTFVIFDIEVVFMYPFAVVFRQLGLFDS